MEHVKKKRKGGIAGWIILLLVCTAAGYLLKMYLPGAGHSTSIDTDTLKSELMRINELATYQKEYRETIIKEKDGFFSKRYYATYDGVIRAGINMDEVTCRAGTDEETGAAVIEIGMPDAVILDHTDSNWNVVYEDGYQSKEIGIDRNTVIRNKKKEVEEAFIDEGGLDRAGERAGKVIEDFIKTSYGEDVIVRFEDREAEQ